MVHDPRNGSDDHTRFRAESTYCVAHDRLDMYVDVRYALGMRITIEVSDCLRAALLQLAAKEGSKGINQIVEEALSHYLVALKRRDRDWGKALKLKGILSS